MWVEIQERWMERGEGQGRESEEEEFVGTVIV